MTGVSRATFHSKALKKSSAQSENSCQSWRGAPSSAQMIGIGYVAGDVGDHVAAAGGGVRVDQPGDHLDDRGVQPRGRPGGERLGDQPAQPVVFGTVETDDQLADPVPHRAAGDALGGQEHTLGHAKPWVAQYGAHQVVAEDFRSVRAQRDRRLPARLADDFVGLVGLGICIGDHRQSGIENAGYGRCRWSRRSPWSRASRLSHCHDAG